jgi:hypothetical protein
MLRLGLYHHVNGALEALPGVGISFGLGSILRLWLLTAHWRHHAMASPFIINPAFRRRPAEAAIIGRLLVAFGELELTICTVAADALNMRTPILRTLYRIRMTSVRVDTAYNLATPFYESHGLSEGWANSHAMVIRCLQIRNQFAHCNWGDHQEGGLFFADLQDAASRPSGLDYQWRHVDCPLLERQEAFFACTLEWLRFMESELAIKQERPRYPAWPKPPEQAPPPSHNPPEQHVPPWLNEDQKALHLARAQAAQGGAPTPTPAQQALDKARAGRRARRQADREQSAKARSRQK